MVDGQDVSMMGHGFCAPGDFPGGKGQFPRVGDGKKRG